MPSWPADLPQSLPNDAQVTRVDGRVMTKMEVGPPKMRRRFPSYYDIPAFRVPLSPDQWESLEYFYLTTLAETGEFTWTDAWLNAGTRTFRFTDPPVQAGTIEGGPDGMILAAMAFQEVP